jgi:hypothetical protein
MSLGETFDDSKIAIDIPPEPDPPATPLFANMAKKKDIHPGDIHRVLSHSMAKGSAPPARKSLVQDCVTYYAANQPAHPILGLKPPSSQDWCSHLTAVQMVELQVMMFGSLTAQNDKLMYKALTTIKVLISQLLQL